MLSAMSKMILVLIIAKHKKLASVALKANKLLKSTHLCKNNCEMHEAWI